MDYVLRHYFNSASRYIALETEFKPKAINMFERLFGAFDRDYSGKPLAQYVKNYINDINGNPSTWEVAINNFLNKTSLFRKFVVPVYGERAALSMETAVASRVGYLKLGFGNISSALLNLTQLINAAGYLGGYGKLMKHFARFNMKSAKRALGKLTRSDVENNINKWQNAFTR